jgi:hypothetical protein
MPCEECILDIGMAKCLLGNRAALDAIPALASIDRRYQSAIVKKTGCGGCGNPARLDIRDLVTQAIMAASPSQKEALMAVLNTKRLMGIVRKPHQMPHRVVLVGSK